MPGQRIYYVPPRMAGPVAGWSGVGASASWLLDHASSLGFNAVWLSPMCVTTNVEKFSKGKKLSGSYYAIRDHFQLDPEFSCGAEVGDIAHLKHFCDEGKKKNIRIYADLVFNHVAADHPLVLEENTAIEEMKKNGHPLPDSFVFKRDRDGNLIVGGEADDPWADVAQIDYSCPRTMEYFVTDANSYFKRVIDWYLNLGFTGFRCDVAYMIPPQAWQELIAYAKAKAPDCVFLAETLGHHQDKVADLAQAQVDGKPAFDLGMLGTHWWNMIDDWLPSIESQRVQRMSKFGGAGSPDNHDTKDTLAGGLAKLFNGKPDPADAIANACLRDYAIAALICNSVYMQMGFEYCNQKQNSVFRGAVTQEDWKTLLSCRKTKADISEGVLAINKLKESLKVENCRVEFRGHHEIANGKLIKIAVDYIDIASEQKKASLALITVKQPENGVCATPASIEAEMKEAGLVCNAAASMPGAFTVYHTPVRPPQSRLAICPGKSKL